MIVYTWRQRQENRAMTNGYHPSRERRVPDRPATSDRKPETATESERAVRAAAGDRMAGDDDVKAEQQPKQAE
jgi:hypothetical protein